MSGESAAGKGDTPRPLSITEEEWAKNWHRIFKVVKGKKNGTVSRKGNKKQTG
jgi:hypothetical protein